MKKLLCILLICNAVHLAAPAQKVADAKVPAAVKAAFIKAHPNTKGDWELEGGNYEVVYKEGGKTMSAVINKKGSLLETETDLSSNELPQAVQAYLAQHYKGAATKGAAKVIKPNGAVNYEVTVKGKELVFDNNGKIMQKESEEKEDEDNRVEHKASKKKNQ